jgi:hypothetical protein
MYLFTETDLLIGSEDEWNLALWNAPAGEWNLKVVEMPKPKKRSAKARDAKTTPNHQDIIPLDPSHVPCIVSKLDEISKRQAKSQSKPQAQMPVDPQAQEPPQ